MSMESVLREFRARLARERAKALKKYRKAGQLPGGDPSRDVFDYAINEQTGGKRYAEMMETRINAMNLPETLRDAALSVCRQLAASSTRHAFDLIDIRQKLLRRGLDLGRPESV